MSPFAADMSKIVVDKGLLALVLLGLGYCLNRALERHRARYAYAQKFSDAKIQAYREIAEALAHQMMTLTGLLQLITHEDQREEMEEASASEIVKVYDTYADAYPAIAVSLLKNSVFFSYDLAERMIKCQGSMAELRGIIHRKYHSAEEYGRARERIRSVAQRLNEDNAMAVHQISQEISYNPFA